jgi:hypothetical protein
MIFGSLRGLVASFFSKLGRAAEFIPSFAVGKAFVKGQILGQKEEERRLIKKAAVSAAAIVGALGVAKIPGAGKLLAKVPGIAFGTPRRAITTLVGVPTAVGVLKASPKAREVAKTALDPRESARRGVQLGEIIEKKRDIPKGIKEGLKTAGIAGGVLGAGAAITAGAVGIIRRGKGKVAAPVMPAGALPLVTVTPDIPVEAEREQEQKVIKGEVPDINVKVSPKNTVIVQNAINK